MMTAGTYVRLARERRDWSLEDLAARLDSDPHVPARRRVDWLAAIEADREVVTQHIAFALADVLEISILQLCRLQALGHAAIAQLDEVPDSVLTMSVQAMLRHTGQPQTFGGLHRASTIARAAGWEWELPGRWRRPMIIGELRQ